MSLKKGEITTYIEDIPMKISESFKPRSFQTNVFSVAPINSIDTTELVYNFKTELFALEVAELKRQKDEEDALRLQQEAELKQSESSESVTEQETTVPADSVVSSDSQPVKQVKVDVVKKVVSSSETSDVVPSTVNCQTPSVSNRENLGILKPESTQFSVTSSNTFVPMRVINPADFESSNSSPFDDALLRAIDDKQELNRVFQQFYSSHKPISSCNQSALPASVLALHMNGVNLRGSLEVANAVPGTAHLPDNSNSWRSDYYSQPSAIASNSSSHVPSNLNGCYIPESFPLRSSKSTPDLKTYQPTEHKASNADRSQTPPLQTNVVNVCDANSSLINDNSQKHLSPDVHLLVNSISKMGFERSRVARAAKELGPDEKKVFEFLFKVQDLEEKGFKGEDAELALLVNNLHVEDAKSFLINMKQLCEVGFHREAVIESLLSCNNDRDLALDDLLSNQ